MHAIQIDQLGKQENSRVVDLQAPPVPGASEVKIAIQLSPLNRPDLVFVAGAAREAAAPSRSGCRGHSASRRGWQSCQHRRGGRPRG